MYRQNTMLTKQRISACGPGPYRPGRPFKECSAILKELRMLCAEQENHVYRARVCRPKMKPGRKPVFVNMFHEAKKPKSVKLPSAAKKPKSVKLPNAALPVFGCYEIRYSADEKRALKSSQTTPGTRLRLKNKCDTRFDNMGRQCKVHVPKGICKIYAGLGK